MPNKCANALAKIVTSQPVDFVCFLFYFMPLPLGLMFLIQTYLICNLTGFVLELLPILRFE